MTARRFTYALVLMLLVLLAAAQVGPTGAATSDGLAWSVGCAGFMSNGGGILLNRDNTGQGRETFTITAVDGAGTVLYGPVTDSFIVGTSLYIREGVFFRFAVTPGINPILVTVVSPSGNGQPQQTIYSVLGFCAGLPSVTDGQAFTLTGFEVVDGTTSPSVPLNTDPPRPVNPQGIGATRVGYLIVNTASLNIRSGDGPHYTVVGRVRGGTELIVLGRNADRSWFFVQVGDIRGWVNSSLTITRGDLTSAPIVPVVGVIAIPTLFVYAANPIRIAPSENAAVICFIDGNLEYYIVGRTGNADWMEIEAACGGLTVTGWILTELGGIRNSGDLPIPITWQ